MPHLPPAKRHPYDQWSPDARALDLVGDKWTLLIVRDLIPGPRRFVELQRVLPGISTEQLRSRLNRMVADGMLTRKRYREVPPRVDYELTARALELAPVLGELARWGYAWSWGAPRPHEQIDITALFRLLPGLVDAHGALRGRVVFTVSDARDGAPAHTLLVLTDGGARVTESSDAVVADARLEGSTADWVATLSPAGAQRLAVSGSDELVGFALGLLTLGRDAVSDGVADIAHSASL